MKIFILILGIFFIGLGLFLTGQAWYAVSTANRVDPTAYLGPFIAIMGLFRIFRALSVVPPHPLLRYGTLGFAILCGYANKMTVEAVYPGATTISLTQNK